jgi:organic radical activating enzyme
VAANLVEIFSSVQGEGAHVGRSTLFVRFGGCDLRCRWCDSPHTWKPARRCRFEVERGSGNFEERENPVDLGDVCAAAERLDVASHAFVSLTGGEPLLQPEAVREVATALRARGPRIHLETHGLAPAALERVVEQIDLVCMDWKLPSDVEWADSARSADDFDALHAEFLGIALRAPEAVVKVVVTPASTDAEIDAVAARMAEIAPEVPLVLQPVTPTRQVPERPGAERLLALTSRLERRLRDVRLIPQTHPIYGAL